jgi:hypothetical protein
MLLRAAASVSSCSSRDYAMSAMHKLPNHGGDAVFRELLILQAQLQV